MTFKELKKQRQGKPDDAGRRRPSSRIRFYQLGNKKEAPNWPTRC